MASRGQRRAQARPTIISDSPTGRKVESTPSGETIIGRITPTGSDVRGGDPKPRGSTKRNWVGERSSSVVSSARRRRNAWEATDAGQARTSDMYDLTNGALTPGQYHFQRNYDRTVSGPRVYDEQLPGLADPDAAPRPPRWDELTSDQQTTAMRGLAEFGTNIDQIASDLGAQYDQGIKRAGDIGQEHAHAESFYSDRTTGPRHRLEQSAAELGIPHTIHAQMNAMTSPNTKFQGNRASTGEVYYPNDEAAKHAVAYVQQRGTAEGITNKFDQTGMGEAGTKAQGYTNNIVKAAKSFEQYEQGISPAEWVTGTKGSGPFDKSPKTGPYANSWSDSHPQFFVSDVHSGGGGAFPHLSSEKPVIPGQFDDEGKPKRAKSERETALEKTPFAHSAIDEAARRAMAERNIGSVREFQAGQWGEEQLQRELVREQDVYRRPRNVVEDPNQGTLF